MSGIEMSPTSLYTPSKRRISIRSGARKNILNVYSRHREEHPQESIRTKRKLDDASASEINRLYPESRRKVEKEEPISEFTPPTGGGGRKRAVDEDETGVTSRGREGKSAGIEGLTECQR
ncbi:hypothetical protein TNCV_2428031 [Trichonephila clavipes]|nr:hypothetical protein TNCV_2428031 [Trichonephila clavipes]